MKFQVQDLLELPKFKTALEYRDRFTFGIDKLDSPEAYLELKKWMDYREQCGENITLDSWLMRNRWDKKKGYSRGLISVPLKLQSAGIKRIIEDALWTQQIRKKLEGRKKRHEFQADHGFRKWFRTRSELAGMKPINTEYLMGHSTGINDSYYRPTENEIFQDYLRAVESLIIEDTNLIKNRFQQLSENSKKREVIVNTKLLEKDKDIELLRQRDSINTDSIVVISDQLTKLIQVERLKKSSVK